VSPLRQPNAPPDAVVGPRLPGPRGELSAELLDALRRGRAVGRPPIHDDALGGDDFHLALYCCYELHYRSFTEAGDDREWDPSVIALRGRLERAFEARLREEVGPPPTGDVVAALHQLAGAPGPSVSRHLAADGQLWQFREFAVHRSAYQLKEADPHTWAIPRLDGAAKAGLVKLQMEEYGDGIEVEMHANLFAGVLEELGLDRSYGAYLDVLPGTTLATTNLISLFGLNRRLRGSLVGHLALFEMTSVTPMSRYSDALTRLGAGPRARRFYDVHVEVDASHEVVAAEAMAGGLVAAHPELASDVLFGAAAANVVEGRFGDALLDAWATGHTSLRSALPC
jgi:Iron-containing redox enzyme